MGDINSRRIFIDQYCFGLLNHLLTPKDFSQKNFSNNNITVLDGKEKDLNFIMKFQEETMIYIMKPNKKFFDNILQIHLMLKAIIPNMKVYIIFIPCENYDIIKHMIFSHVKEDFTIENLNIDLIPIDNDLLSLEKDNCLKEIYLDQDYTSVTDLAYSLVKLETIFGKVKHKYIKGDLGLKFCKILEEKEKENIYRNATGEILGLLAFDRSVDFITLMTTNYTYEGMIDEKFGINFGRIKVKEKILKENLYKKPVTSDKLVTYGLTTEFNEFFCSLRCMHHLDVIKYLVKIREHFKLISDKNKSKKNNMTMAELHDLTSEINYFVSKLREPLIINENIINNITQSLNEPNHLKYIEKEQLLLSGAFPNNLHDFYDELLFEKKDINGLIRLMILESLTQNGIKDYYNLKREILNIFGYQYIFLLRDLETLGFFKEKILLKSIKKNMTTMTFNQMNEKLGLIKFDFNREKIEDCSYVLGGYCPLSLKIVEKAVTGKWSTIIDVLKKLPGPTKFPEDESEINNPKNDKNIILLVFIGGITYTEIEGIRFLNMKFNEEYNQGKRKKVQFIILTTGILNSEKIFSNLGKEVHSSFTIKKFNEDANKRINKK